MASRYLSLKDAFKIRHTVEVCGASFTSRGNWVDMTGEPIFGECSIIEIRRDGTADLDADGSTHYRCRPVPPGRDDPPFAPIRFELL